MTIHYLAKLSNGHAIAAVTGTVYRLNVLAKKTCGLVFLMLALGGGCDDAGSEQPSKTAIAKPDPNPDPKPDPNPAPTATQAPKSAAAEETAKSAADSPSPATVALEAGADVWVEQATALVTKNELTEAAALYDKALKAAPDHADAAAGLARVHLAQDNPKEAARLFAIATPHLEDDAGLWRDLGDTRARLKQYAESVTAYAKAHTLAPDDLDIALAHGRAVRLSGKPEDAIALLEAVADADPKAKYVYTELGDAQREAGKLDAALKSYMRGQAQYRSDKEALAGAALVYEAKGDKTRAIDQWSSYVRMDCCSTFAQDVALEKIKALGEATP